MVGILPAKFGGQCQNKNSSSSGRSARQSHLGKEKKQKPKAFFAVLSFASHFIVVKVRGKTYRFFLFLFLVLSSLQISAETIDNETAQDLAARLHLRLTGVPADLATLQTMMIQIQDGHVEFAAFTAMQNKYFYQLTLKNFFNPISNKSQSSALSLNDFTATLIGIVKNNISFKTALYGDIIFTAQESLQTNPGLVRANNTFVAGQVRPILRNVGDATNPLIQFRDYIHYEDLEKFNDWSNRLQQRTQSEVFAATTRSRVDQEDIAGVLTTRQWHSEYSSAGTNRRNVRFAFLGWFGKDMQDLHDSSVPDARVRQDVDRSPGGNSETFLNTCLGCHGALDAFASAFAYFDYPQDSIVYNRVLGSNNKQYRNATVFPQGYRIMGNDWINFWTTGRNSSLGWRTSSDLPTVQSGNGVKSFGMLIANSQAFANNLATKVFSRVCLKSPTQKETETLLGIARKFETGFPEYSALSASNPENLRALFAETSKLCFKGNP